MDKSAGKPAVGTAADAGQDSGATFIELNFNAFADNVPPTKHAKRVPRSTDPSVQDFADQALELAALRAELKRLTRDYEALMHSVHIRDARLQRSHDELVLARSKSREWARSAPEASPRLALVKEEAASAAAEAAEARQSHQNTMADELSATVKLQILRVDPSAGNAEALRATQQTKALLLTIERQLIPVGHDGEIMILRRDIITVGRTRENDICIPSHAVSRDHARLLMSPRSVTVVDMNSANGCFVNDEPVKRQQLKEGDVLRIGDRAYRFTVRNSPPPPARGPHR